MIEWILFAQISPVPDTPKTGDLNQWVGWLVSVLALTVLGIVAYLIRTAAQKDGDIKTAYDTAKVASNELTSVFREIITELKDRHAEEIRERIKDRDATVLGFNQVKDALIKVSETHVALTHEITSVKEEVRRNGGSK